tara:strand:+ start:562 stop:1188 length:627 start_codon:yes stop_codon:yes gene_type:complete
MNVVENKYLENVLNTKQIDTLLSIYNDAGEYQTDAMRKHTGSKNLTSTLEVLAESTKIDIDRIEICHFYCHKTPYFPHTDFHHKEKENIVLPLQVTDGPNPYLVVFDQWYNNDGKTWTFKTNHEFKVNKAVKCRPCDFGDDINGITDKEVSNELYEYLQHWPKKYWFGLTGKPYEFIPGNGIQFDSRKIHATSTMYCKEKLGLTIRYS